MSRNSDSDYGNPSGDTTIEKNIFDNLAERDIQLVLERVKASKCPWWGIGYLAKSDIADNDEVHDIIKGTAENIAAGISISDMYWEILGNIEHYPWLLDDEHILRSIVEKVRTTSSPAQVHQLQPYLDILIKHDIFRDALLQFLKNSEYPETVLEVAENHSSFFNEQSTIKTIESKIKTSENPWILIKTALGIRLLAENETIRAAIKSRFPDIVAATRSFETIWTPVESICSDPEFLNDSMITDAIVESLKHPEISKNIINLIVRYYEITSKSEIQHAIVDALTSKDGLDMMNILVPIHDLPHVMQSDDLTESLISKLDDFVEYYAQENPPLSYIALISEVPELIGHEPIHSALYDNLPEIVEDVKKGFAIYELMPFYVHSSWFMRILRDEKWKEAVIQCMLKPYGYHPFVSIADHLPWLYNHPAVVDSIAKFIRTHHDPFEPVYFLLKVPQFKDKPAVMDALTQRSYDIYETVRTGTCSFDDLESLSKIPFFSESQDYVDAVLDSLTNIDQPWLIAEIAHEDKRIIDTPLFAKSIEENIPNLVKTLTGNEYRLALNSLSYIQDILKNESVRAALETLSTSLIRKISDYAECWFIINDASVYPFLEEHPALMKAILSRIDDLVFAIERRRDNFEVISQISWCKELLKSQKIVDAVVYAILHHNEPWEICDIQNPENLFKNEAIREAVLSRASDIAYLIEYNREGRTIAEIVERFDFLTAHEEIKSAIESLRSHPKIT
ncbi:MAG: hypothetical protein BAJATHORv1_10592 [Candidatus Thorarchaeota archaeon]|nr:MAG: hypothetical protein BAJATHORv1_10592 [Candidatus Thorarchaeota archaeon]